MTAPGFNSSEPSKACCHGLTSITSQAKKGSSSPGNDIMDLKTTALKFYPEAKYLSQILQCGDPPPVRERRGVNFQRVPNPFQGRV